MFSEQEIANVREIAEKLYAVFDKWSGADTTSPKANYSIQEVYLKRAINGDILAKKTLVNSISQSAGIDLNLVRVILEVWINNRKKRNKLKVRESMGASKKLVRLTESDLHRIVKESVDRILKESFGDESIESFLFPINRLI